MKNAANEIIKKYFGNDYHGLGDAVRPAQVERVMQEYAKQDAIIFAQYVLDHLYWRNLTITELYTKYKNETT